MAGKMVNMTTPTALVGGEPLKAYLLKPSGVPMEDGLASVVVAKTTMTLAHIFYILLGMSLAVWMLPPSGPAMLPMLAIGLSVGLVLFGITVLVIIHHHGVCTSLLGLLRRLRIQCKYVEVRKEKLVAFDRSVHAFYTQNRPAFFQSTGAFFLGWLTEALEVYAMLFFLGAPIDIPTAVALDALSTFIKGGDFLYSRKCRSAGRRECPAGDDLRLSRTDRDSVRVGAAVPRADLDSDRPDLPGRDGMAERATARGTGQGQLMSAMALDGLSQL